MSRIWLGVDIGTQGVRAAAYSSDGRLMAEGHAQRQPRTPSPGAMVHDPERDWWGGTREALEPVVERVAVERIGGIGLAGLFPALCLLDRRLQPIGEGLLYGDQRASAEVSRVADKLGTPLTGDEVAPKLIWLRRSAASRFRRTSLVLGPAGFVGLRLTGTPSIDPHSAVRWGGIANESRDGWQTQALHRIGIPADILPPIRRPHDAIGSVTHEAARATGLRAGTPVVAGATDSFAELLGTGVSRPGEGMIYYGSSGTMLVCTADLQGAALEPAKFTPVSPYRLAAYAVNLGSFLERLRAEVLGGAGYEQLDRAASAVKPGSEGLFVVPHVTGRMTPQPQATTRGAIIGLHLGHERAHIWRAVLESFGYILREAEASLDVPLVSVVAAGGGANSRVWREIVSDVTGWPQRLAPPGGAARGAAFLAAFGMGEVASFSELRNRWLDDRPGGGGNVVTPDEANVSLYGSMFDAWRSCEATVAELSRPET